MVREIVVSGYRDFPAGTDGLNPLGALVTVTVGLGPMNELSNQQKAVELLQELGLKEYEAKAYVALSRRESGTAKDISETSAVPRTRVYDAIRVLETKGLVETQHSNPQVFRAVSIDRAVEILRSEYEQRADSLRTSLREIEPVETEETTEVTHEVWALSGEPGITNRSRRLIEGAEEELLFVIGDEGIFTEELAASLAAAGERGVDVIIGTSTEELRNTVEATLPETEVFVSGLEWLGRSGGPDDETEISRLILVDRQAILVSSITDPTGESGVTEQAVFGRGFDNGLVAIVRRLMATGLMFSEDPGIDEDHSVTR